jgi:hypothetical protein
MDAAAENPLIRRHLLEVLEAAGSRMRSPGDDVSTYVAEALLQSQLALRGFPLPMERLRQELYYLYERGKSRERDAGYVHFKRTKVGREEYFRWRITDLGRDVLEGARHDASVASA